MALDESYEQYLKDESRINGNADEIHFPKTIKEVEALVKELKEQGKCWTVQGARTGIYGNAVPKGGAVINLSGLTGIGEVRQQEDHTVVTVLAGTPLTDLQEFCRTGKAGDGLFFPVETSEPTATLGGVFAENARGISASLFGSCRNYLVRAEGVSQAGQRVCCSGEDLAEHFPVILTELTVRLVPKPPQRWGVLFFFEDGSTAPGFAQTAAGICNYADCLYFHHGVFQVIDQFRPDMSRLGEIPAAPAAAEAAVYVELSGDSEEEIQEILMELLDRFALEGGRDEDTWAVSGEEIEKLRLICHAALELEGMLVDQYRRERPGFLRQCLEYQVPAAEYPGFIRWCLEHIEGKGKETLLFGDAQEGHVHIGLFPAEGVKENEIKEILREILNKCRELGGEIGGFYGCRRDLEA